MAVGQVSGPVFGEGGMPLPKLQMGNAAADRLVPGIAKALETLESEAPNTTYEQRRKHSQKLMELLMLLKGVVENKRARGESIDEDADSAKDPNKKKDPQQVKPVEQTPSVPTLS